jgi:very-short-patch-repair endonuclease
VKRAKIKCEKCGREISRSNYSKHLKSCDGIKRNSFKKLKECPYCGKDLSNIHGGNHVRWCKKNPNINEEKLEKQRELLKKAREKITSEKRKKINKKIKEAWKKGAYKNVDHGKIFRGKHHSKESKNKISESRKKFLRENPEKHPWKKNKKFISEPCEYLKTILKENSIKFEEEYQPLENRYFSIDIAFPKEKIGIEINGNQHYNKNKTLKKYYQNRHNLIEAEGWKLLEFHYLEVYKDNILDIINL